MGALLQWAEDRLCSFKDSYRLFNYCGVLYTLFIVVGILVVNAYYTCPKLYGSEQCELPILFGYFILAQIVANIFLFHFHRRRNTLAHWFPGKLRKNQDGVYGTKFARYCAPCDETVPVRSHHCPLCHYCVLRKDHHCFMVGGCVGFGNQRYFIVFLFWASIGAAYGTSFTYSYLNKYYAAFWPYGWIEYIAPFALKKWLLTRHMSVLNLFMTVLFSFGAASTVGALGFFLSQMFFAIKGTTMYDYSNRHRRGYQAFEPGTVNERLRCLFGPNWALNFICPQPWFKNQLGVEFKQNIYAACTKEL